MYNQNLHTHGNLADGVDSYESIVERAIELGFNSIGFSEHAYMFYSDYAKITPQTIPTYKAEINRLKQKYNGIIPIYLGLEFDQYSTEPTSGFEYIIASNHYLKKGDIYISFDRDFNTVKNLIDNYFNGNSIDFACEYYKQFSTICNYVKPDIIGHFDIITKHNSAHPFIDTTSKKYRESAIDCLRELAKKVDVFEVNTGAMTRYAKQAPYPEKFILKELLNLKKQVIISSDCHDKRYLNANFIDAENLLKEVGFKNTVIFNGKTFIEKPL
ncbi:MAG: histidinol-phosphatase HisJ family protein [Clostridia bacterium]|nr:histidinol-phosphatase HisJ family protein [Clostridia bacterium]